MHQKINRAMMQTESERRLEGAVQLDDAYLGGERAGGKGGRGSENKLPCVAAVSLKDQGHPLYLKRTPLVGFTSQAIGQWAKNDLLPGAAVTRDGLACFFAVTSAGCVHQPIVVGSRKPRELPEFTWINTVLGNLKTSLSGALHAFNFRKYATPYLAALAYRFNRRFDLPGLFARLVVDAALCKPRTERAIRGKEAE